jgi:hypothetical protein
MKKTILFLILIILLLIPGCSNETNTSMPAMKNDAQITLSFSFGERSGTYVGDLEDGVPHGFGKFTTKNSEGNTWWYEGSWVKGHFDGPGKTTWSDGTVDIGTYKNDEIVPLSGDEILPIFGSNDALINHFVEIRGKVFNDVEYTDDGIAFQVWADSKNSEKNTIVYFYDKNVKIKSGDYVRLVGKVGSTFKGKNAFGAEISAPTIIAASVNTITYMELTPIIGTIDVNETQEEHGYKVTLEKVEFTEEETRFFITVVNDSKSNLNIYTYSSKVVQNNRQFEPQSNYMADYPELQSDLLPGIVSDGILTFPPLQVGDLQLMLKCSSSDYNLKLEYFIFNIKP